MDVGRLRTRLAPALLLACAGGCASVFGPTTAASFMKIVETNNDPNARYNAYRSLGDEQVYDDAAQKNRAAQLLVGRLKPGAEPNASRAVICRSLGILGDPSARDAVLALCHDPDPLIRAEAFHALGKLGKPEDSTILMQAMTLDQDDTCKTAAIEALGMLKQVDPRTEGYLVRALDHDDPRIRYAALQSLRRISHKDLGAKPEPWRAYILVKYGEKIEAPKVQLVEHDTFDPAAAMASMPGDGPNPGGAAGSLSPSGMPMSGGAMMKPGLVPPGATGRMPTLAPGATWDRAGNIDGPGLPSVAPGSAMPGPASPGQQPPIGSTRGIMSRVLGY